MIQQKTKPQEWPVLLKTSMNGWIKETFQGLHWHIETLRQNTDEMRKEIKKLKENNK